MKLSLSYRFICTLVTLGLLLSFTGVSQTLQNQKLVPQMGGGESTGSTIKSIFITGQTITGKSAGSTVGTSIGFFPIGYNEDPNDITVHNSLITENQDSLTFIGLLSASDPEENDTHTFSLTSGTGDDDNASFTIKNDSLFSASVFDFETKDTYSIRIETDDGDGGFYQEAFSIQIQDANDTPTDIYLDNLSIEENSVAGTVVGNLSTEDQDPLDLFTYSLSSGTGDDNNDLFRIIGNALESDTVFNFEVKSSYNIRVTSTDSSNTSVEKAFVITIDDMNDTPTDISLDNNTRPENDAIGTAIGELTTTDQDVADTFVYSLVSGTGDNDNTLFGISGNQLITADTLNFENQETYSVRIQTDDQNGGTYDEIFEVSITDINDVPDDVTISNATIKEGLDIGTLVGIFGTIDQDDPDRIDTYTYNLVPGTGSDNNSAFSIQSNNQLISAISFNRTDQDTYSIRVRSTDGGGLSLNKIMIITITSAAGNSPPLDISLSKNSFYENDEEGTLIGTFSTSDPDPDDAHTYTLVSGTGDSHNGGFEIFSNELKVDTTLNISETTNLLIRVRSTDRAGDFCEKSFTIIAEPYIDIIPPEINTDNLTNPSYVSFGSGTTIEVTVTDNDAVSVVIMWVRKILDSDFNQKDPVSISSDKYTFTIADEEFDSLGAEFYITAEDISGNKAQTDDNNYQIFRKVSETNSPQIPITRYGGTLNDYQIISIPYSLDNKTIEKIFESIIGEYDDTKWRLVAYKNGQFVDYKKGISTIDLGVGYWFNAVNPEKLSLIKTGAGSVNTTIPFPMFMSVGWNLIGNPYNIPISWEKVREDPDNTALVEEILTYESNSLTFSPGDVIQPFSGGYVWSDETATVRVDPSVAYSGGRIGAMQDKEDIINKDGWMVPLSIMNNEQEYKLGGFGMHPEASILKDIYDEMTVPRFANYLELFTMHDSYFYPWFSTDIIPTQNEYRWTYTLESNLIDGNITIEWGENNKIDNIAQLWLIDELQGRKIDMKKQESYSFNFSEKHIFSVYYSTDPNSEIIPTNLILGNAYPNPFNTTTTIPIYLPEAEKKYGVEIAIYDLNGKKVKSLVNDELTPGIYEILWHGENEAGNPVAPGVYLYQIVFSDSKLGVLQKRLILQP